MEVRCVYLYFHHDQKSYLFLERGREGESEGEKYQCVKEKRKITWLPPTCPQLGELANNPGMCPDQESNQRPFDLQVSAQSTELNPLAYQSASLVDSIPRISCYRTSLPQYTFFEISHFYCYDRAPPFSASSLPHVLYGYQLAL